MPSPSHLWPTQALVAPQRALGHANPLAGGTWLPAFIPGQWLQLVFPLSFVASELGQR